jgi:hypothetical protein
LLADRATSIPRFCRASATGSAVIPPNPVFIRSSQLDVVYVNAGMLSQFKLGLGLQTPGSGEVPPSREMSSHRISQTASHFFPSMNVTPWLDIESAGASPSPATSSCRVSRRFDFPLARR